MKRLAVVAVLAAFPLALAACTPPGEGATGTPASVSPSKATVNRQFCDLLASVTLRAATPYMNGTNKTDLDQLRKDLKTLDDGAPADIKTDVHQFVVGHLAILNGEPGATDWLTKPENQAVAGRFGAWMITNC
ncbi:hypothetical protein Lfu02_11090 [Longispora fulva]|uniref:DUF732 domain-containing protein n=1 Tax=Longispora fulva TaxID=619741 RepID=A0A8J7GNP5_9ACTN|nr:hypothetical protein [Longispora fulva]MBG6135028.1 hypothetical protein [Longispora fulva]GIG56737.1 hypothetical protein Lfu02_11090 [Longispora fulva]